MNQRRKLPNREISGSKHTEEVYRTILRTAMDGFLLTDKLGRFLDVNEAYCHLTGYSRDELLTMRIHDVEVLETREETDRHVGRVMESGSERFQTRHRCKDGGIVDVEVSVNYMEGNGLFVFLRDITERKRADEALRRSEEAARRLLKETAIVAEIGRIISVSLNIEDVYESFAKEVSKLIPIDRIAVNLHNLAEGTFKITYLYGLDVRERRVDDVYPLKGSAGEKVACTRSALLIHAKTPRELESRFPTLLAVFQAGLRSMIAVPLIFRDEAIGVLHLQSKRTKAYSEQDIRLAESIAAQIAGAVRNAQLYRERKQAIEALEKREKELEEKSKNLEEVNAALRVLLEYRQKDKIELEKKVLANIETLVLPYLEQLRADRLNKSRDSYLEIIQKNLNEITSAFIHDLKSKYLKLTPREIQIAHLIKSGKTTKEIAEVFHISTRTVDFYRDNIRNKLGLKNKNINLASHLASL